MCPLAVGDEYSWRWPQGMGRSIPGREQEAQKGSCKNTQRYLLLIDKVVLIIKMCSFLKFALF